MFVYHIHFEEIVTKILRIFLFLLSPWNFWIVFFLSYSKVEKMFIKLSTILFAIDFNGCDGVYAIFYLQFSFFLFEKSRFE